MAVPIRAAEPPGYAALLEGKRVVIVGPAASIQGSGLGEFIDSHDVVVRLNLAAPVPQERQVDVGARTDILYHVLYSAKHLQAMGREHTREEIAAWCADGVRFLVARHPATSERVQRLKSLLPEDGSLPLIHIPQAFRKGLEQTCGASPNTGTLAIAHLLEYPIASLHVTGFDFYASGYYVGYGGFDEGEATRGGGEGIARPAWGQSDDTREIHRQEGQLRFLADLHRREPRLSFDEIAAGRLGLPAGEQVITALVPMKGNSERVPGKNKRPLFGRPLLYWTLDALIRARRVARVVVDTDSEEIARLVRQHHPRVEILMRPEELRDGQAVTGNDLIAWELTQVEGEHFGQFHVTSPLLTPETIDRAVARYFAGLEEGEDSLFTVTEHQFWLFRADGSALNSDPRRLVRSQDLEPLYEDNSAAHLFSRSSFAATGSRIGERVRMLPIPRVEAIDIDTEEDFALADAVMRGLAAIERGRRGPYARTAGRGRVA